MGRFLAAAVDAESGTIVGGILLIAGSCIGAGMLALPVVTGCAGFLPSVCLFLVAWFFMTATGLLLLEVNLSVGHDLSLISLVERTLGRWGKGLCWILFLFLFYVLNVAYLVAMGALITSLAADILGLTLPSWGGSLLCTLLFAAVVYRGVLSVDRVNRGLVVGLIVSYAILVFLGSTHMHVSYLTTQQWGYTLSALPVLIVSFGFHNMIPTLARYTKGHLQKLRAIVVLGSALPLLIYLIWEAVMLGIIPCEGCQGLRAALDHGEAVTQALRTVVGHSWISHVAQGFAFFAITTSFLAQTLSLVDFLSDGCNLPQVGRGRLLLVGMALLPPLGCALLYPGIFILALRLAGGFAAVILFGVMPILMAWRVRYFKKSSVDIMPWGRPMLVLLLGIALGIFVLQCADLLS